MRSLSIIGILVMLLGLTGCETLFGKKPEATHSTVTPTTTQVVATPNNTKEDDVVLQPRAPITPKWEPQYTLPGDIKKGEKVCKRNKGLYGVMVFNENKRIYLQSLYKDDKPPKLTRLK